MERECRQSLLESGGQIRSAIAYRWARARNTPLLAAALHVPQRRAIDRNLVIGAAVFGIGWGLAGVCPGPAVALLATGQPFALVFAAAMVAGVLIHGLLHRPRLAKE
ncbi:YeeE/YedE family protein [Stenotrophomonas sp. PA-6-5C]|nr:YeeE/YedE family protein [Stenotrophomonas sp. PA-6-5C]